LALSQATFLRDCKLLVSVRSRDEALAAIQGGADWIDIKDPDNGPLGAASDSQIAEVVVAVGGQLPVSAALGELANLDHRGGWALPDLSGVGLVKVGLSRCGARHDWQNRLADLAHSLPRSVSLVAVHYADQMHADSPRLEQLLAAARGFESPALLVDTFGKRQGCLLDYYSPHGLAEAFSLARAQSMQCVVAGSLRLEHLSDIGIYQPDVVAVRGAVCNKSDRRSSVSVSLVQELRQALAKETARFC